MKDCNSKMFKNFLTMYYLSAPDKLEDKRSAIAAHRVFMKELSHEPNHAKV